MPPTWQIGDRIQNRWEIHNILGGYKRSGMGIVYVVYDHKLHEPFAAKTFQDEIFAHSPVVAERFKKEALSWVNLDAHQNIAKARFALDIEGKPYLFLEYVSGGDLSGWIGTLRLPESLPQLLQFAIQFCDGMTHAISKGIKAHRDIKPQNCLITQHRTLKVTDFGLAKTFDDTAEVKEIGDVKSLNIVLTRTGVAAGTPTYMAPEQFDDARNVDVRADIYSFGVMFYQMLEGQLPFVGQSWEELARLHKTEKLPTQGRRSPEVNVVVQRCLAKSPGDRFSDFVALRVEIASIYERLTGEPAPRPAVGRELDAIELDDKGCALGVLGRPEEALACFEKAVALEPHLAEAWYNKGVSLRKLGRLAEALDYFDRALEVSPRFAEAWSQKARVWEELGRTAEALECLDRLSAVSPRYEGSWYSVGNVLVRSGRLVEALSFFDRAIKVNPHLEQEWSSKGAVLADLGRLRESLECFDQALKINPHLESAWYNKGVALAGLGNPEEAIACFDRALKINPRLSEAWNNKGAMLVNGFQRYREALVCFEEAKRLGHSQADAAIALCRTKLGLRA